MDKVTEKGVIIKGYKATDESMKCRGYQFELGKWHEHTGKLEMCAGGFHFCEYPSGPYCFYTDGRVFHVEAEFVLLGTDTGADLKHVAKRIRLVSEIETGNKSTDKGSTGVWNAGDGNKGDWNTGDYNKGEYNTGTRNTGDRNAGDGNKGDWNSGNRNSGNSNTGTRNTGNRNTGDCNMGDYNAGSENVGCHNAGNGNVGDYHSGCLNHGEAKFFIFNEPANRDDVDFYLVSKLSQLMMRDDEIDAEMFLSLPNATPERIKALHDAHKAARAELKQDTSQGAPTCRQNK